MNDQVNEIVIAAFYHFVKLPDYKALQQPLIDLCNQEGIRGTILLAEEGINSTIAGTREGIDMVLNSLRDDPRFADMKHKESYADFIPFQRLKVRLKKEIVTLKVDVDPNALVGTYLEPEEWNQVISDPDVVVIDTRNDYEIELGSFQHASNPHTASFSDLPDYVAQNLDPQKHKRVAMFCTGGIRCEKATSFMLQQGFEEVYHLNGGILRYLELTPEEKSLWEGECFVFDERVTVDHQLKPGKAAFCTECKALLHDKSEPCSNCGHLND